MASRYCVLHPSLPTAFHAHTCPPPLKATLSSGLDLRLAVALPDDEEYNDWVAVHLVDFFNRINIIYGTVCEFCTGKTCPVMSGGPKFEYYWADEKHKKPQAVSAPQVCVWVRVNTNGLYTVWLYFQPIGLYPRLHSKFCCMSLQQGKWEFMVCASSCNMIFALYTY